MSASADVVFGFAGLAAAIAVAFVAAVGWSRRQAEPADRKRVIWLGVGLSLWLALTFALAATGALAFGTLPPRVMVLFTVTLVLAIVLARSAIGRDLAVGLPFSILIGFQAFRVLVEFLIHRAAQDGLAPPQMTWSGFNFDVVTGLTALPVAWLAARGRATPTIIRAWNVLGVLLLVNVLVIAIVSMPTPLRLFMNEPANTWVSKAPFVWLPTVLVPAAIVGHILVWRKLRLAAS